MGKQTTPDTTGLVGELLQCGRQELVAVFTLSMFINLLALTVPIFMLQVFTHVLTSHSKETLVLITAMGLVALATWGVLSNIRSHLLRCIGDKVDLLLGERVQKAMIARATKSNEVRTASGLKDLATLRSTVSGPQAAALMDVPWSPLFIVVTYLLSPILGSIAVGGIILLLAIAWANNRATQRPQQEASQSAQSELAFALASLRNAEVVEG